MTEKKRQLWKRSIIFMLLFVFSVGISVPALSKSLTVKAGNLSPKRKKYIIRELRPCLTMIKDYYYKAVDQKSLLKRTLNEIGERTSAEEAMRRLVSKLGDPYSMYFNVKEYEAFKNSLKGEYFGIGIEVRSDKKSGGVLITKVFPKSPAKKAGLKKNDIIIKIDGKSILFLPLDQVTRRIRGEKYSKAVLTVLRGKKKLVFRPRREEIVVPTVFSKYLRNQELGYVKVSGFLESTDESFEETLDRFEEKGIRGLIIDLRDNGGGYVYTAENMLNRILPTGEKLFSYQYRSGNTLDFLSKNDENGKDKVLNVPIVILQNKNSASASEIFAGALADNNMAVIVGERSFGKGVAQSYYDLTSWDNHPRGGIKLTTIKYYLPKGESIHQKGITPDYRIVNGKNRIDSQLEKAKALLAR